MACAVLKPKHCHVPRASRSEQLAGTHVPWHRLKCVGDGGGGQPLGPAVLRECSPGTSPSPAVGSLVSSTWQSRGPSSLRRPGWPVWGTPTPVRL